MQWTRGLLLLRQNPMSTAPRPLWGNPKRGFQGTMAWQVPNDQLIRNQLHKFWSTGFPILLSRNTLEEYISNNQRFRSLQLHGKCIHSTKPHLKCLCIPACSFLGSISFSLWHRGTFVRPMRCRAYPYTDGSSEPCKQFARIQFRYAQLSSTRPSLAARSLHSIVTKSQALGQSERWQPRLSERLKWVYSKYLSYCLDNLNNSNKEVYLLYYIGNLIP